MKLELQTAGGSRATLLPERGGLLSSLALKSADGMSRDVLWLSHQFDLRESGWPAGGMPLMFPFAGRVFHGLTPFQYELAGKIWQMPLHGFAYAHKWRVVAADDRTAVLSLHTSDASRQLFPFDFDLKVKYTLNDTSLLIDTEVSCLGAHSPLAPRMPMALGWHPYFYLPKWQGSVDATARLQTSAQIQLPVTAIGGAGKPTAFPGSSLPDHQVLHQAHLSNLILGDLKSDQALVEFPASGYAIALGWDPSYRYLVLWTQSGQEFHCVEPWMGLPDALNNGAGLRWLAPSESHRSRVTIGIL